MCPRSPSIHGRTQINHGVIPMDTSLLRIFSLSFSLYKSLSVVRNTARISAMRRERRRGKGFACFASWLRQFVSAATNAAVVAARLGPTGPPTLSVFPSAGFSAALSSVDHTSPRTSPWRFPRARLLFTHIPLVLSTAFVFVVAIRRCTYDRGYLQYFDTIDR